MNTCERIQEIILTDYIDGQIPIPAMKTVVEQHVQACAKCSVFLADVKKELLTPFAQVKQQPVPSELWFAIKKTIEMDGVEARQQLTLWEKIKEFFPQRLVVPSLSGLALLVLVAGIMVNQHAVKEAKEKEQKKYLAEVVSSEQILVAQSRELGTAIEQYFL